MFALEKPDSKSDEEWEFKHEQVCGYIRQWVEENVVNHIANETYARTLWYKLETLYASKIGDNKLFLLKQAMNLRYKEESSILDHLNEFQGCFDQLSSMSVMFDEDIRGLWLLNTLSDSWENFRVSLTNSATNGIVTMEYVKSSVLNEEVGRKTQGSSSSHSKVLVTESKGRSQSKGQEQNGRGRTNPKTRKQEKNDDGKHNDHVATVTSEDFFILYDDDVFIGIGDVCLEMDYDSSLLLRGVKHIPDIRLNLISTGKLDDEGYCNTFSDAFVHIPKDERHKLDMKTRRYIFIGYGLDEFGYRLYDPIERKLVRSHDVVFMDNQTIQDVEKAEKAVSQYSDGLIDLYPVPFTNFPTNVEHDVQDDQQDLDDAYALCRLRQIIRLLISF
ncbi:hypothetical protein Patl1_13561 [Pistacia atlantica]|uniref:Uncharacterized protein n=1 Tax=Pistacia atlantica TaxID=434234 RepID=A0ACC1AW69_9ROSI|nr:hypothetical protein Patl1_13561 [Pistacia atlantica]